MSSCAQARTVQRQLLLCTTQCHLCKVEEALWQFACTCEADKRLECPAPGHTSSSMDTSCCRCCSVACAGSTCIIMPLCMLPIALSVHDWSGDQHLAPSW